jgi:hypothetical protein
MTVHRGSHSRSDSGVDAAILAAIDDGTVLIGSIGSLAKALGATSAELRRGLRELLEERKIAVHAQPDGRLTVRLERRQLDATPSLPRPPSDADPTRTSGSSENLELARGLSPRIAPSAKQYRSTRRNGPVRRQGASPVGAPGAGAACTTRWRGAGIIVWPACGPVAIVPVNWTQCTAARGLRVAARRSRAGIVTSTHDGQPSATG